MGGDDGEPIPLNSKIWCSITNTLVCALYFIWPCSSRLRSQGGDKLWCYRQPLTSNTGRLIEDSAIQNCQLAV